jgi:hypothetical protein
MRRRLPVAPLLMLPCPLSPQIPCARTVQQEAHLVPTVQRDGVSGRLGVVPSPMKACHRLSQVRRQAIVTQMTTSRGARETHTRTHPTILQSLLQQRPCLSSGSSLLTQASGTTGGRA